LLILRAAIVNGGQALPNIEQAKLSADLIGVSSPGRNPWIARSGGGAKVRCH
jgi:hypothetical protein